MKQTKRILVLSSSEYRILLYVLIDFRHTLIQQGRYTETILASVIVVNTLLV